MRAGEFEVGATRTVDSAATHAVAVAHALDSLFAARHDDATAHFDAELAAAVADGRVDEETARTLRWWQRAAVRGAQSYLVDLLPGVLQADDAARRKSRGNAEFAATSWRAATDTIHSERHDQSTHPNQHRRMQVRLISAEPTRTKKGSGHDDAATLA